VTEPESAAPVRLASTILLVRDGAGGLEIFMVKRHHEIDFASGALVFPGGSVEDGDHAIAANETLCPPVEGVSADLLALRVGAIRETFEECGILLARGRGARDLVPGDTVDFIEAEGGRDNFLDALARNNLSPAVDLLVPFAHWVTPTFMPKRFDTHFFIAAAPPDQAGRHDGRESVDSVWINPARALEEAQAGQHTIIFPTRLNLRLLVTAGSVADAMAMTQARTIVTVVPEPVTLPTGRGLRIPLEAGYGGDVFEI
jgi:8-oxo-dGTP pyrophosphatase MutT (NUDIX family)